MLGCFVDTELDSYDLRRLIPEFKDIFVRETGLRDFPDDPHEQLALAITAVFDSWNNPRART